MVLDFDAPSLHLPFLLIRFFFDFLSVLNFFLLCSRSISPYMMLLNSHLVFQSFCLYYKRHACVSVLTAVALVSFFFHCVYFAIGIATCSYIGKHFIKLLNCGLLCQLIRYFLGLITICFVRDMEQIHMHIHWSLSIYFVCTKWEQAQDALFHRLPNTDLVIDID